jgi:hypothetical protein
MRAEAIILAPAPRGYYGCKRVYVLCPYCGGEHIHGANPGFRVAHCSHKFREAHPEVEAGYWLVKP